MVKRHVNSSTAMTPVGTPCWTAPEVLRNEPYTEKADGEQCYLLHLSCSFFSHTSFLQYILLE
jgi:serine/threonine protein kinase